MSQTEPFKGVMFPLQFRWQIEETMKQKSAQTLHVLSLATVYGWPKQVPCTEEFPLSAAARTKLMIEEICRDLYQSDHGWKIILLRYFNPVGAHPSGNIGEDPRGIPNNLMPFVQLVAVGRRPALTIFGTDYKTSDGTGVRDYIHVVDLADGHIAALNKLEDPKIGCEVYNLGTGKGTSVLEMVKAFENASGKNASFEFDHLVKANSQAVAGLITLLLWHAREIMRLKPFMPECGKKICNQGTEVWCCVMATEQEAGTSQV